MTVAGVRIANVCVARVPAVAVAGVPSMRESANRHDAKSHRAGSE